MGRYRIPVPVMRGQEKTERFPPLLITLIARTASCKFSFLTIFTISPFSISNVRAKIRRNLVSLHLYGEKQCFELIEVLSDGFLLPLKSYPTS